MNKFKEKDSFDSPYKHCLSEIKCVDTNNEDDNFTTPKVTKRITKTIKKQVKKKPKCVKSQRIDTMFRKAQNSINDLDVNPDHMQMAIALSKSTLDQENPDESKRVNAEDSQHTFGQSYDQKLGNMLERYGFKSTRSSFKSGTVLNQEKGFQNKKYPRFAYSLFSTTKEDRDNLIEKKISAILSQCQTNLENGTVESNIFSNLLKNHHVKQSKLVKVHSFDINEEVSKYYTINLNLPRTNSSCGCLLKDWKVIPGRELSPIRGEQNPENLLNDGSRKSAFGLENTNSSESLERRLTYSSSNEQFQSEQASLCETDKENNSSDRTNKCSIEKTKENNCFLDVRVKNNTEIDVGIESNQIEMFNSESHNSFSSSTLDNIAGMKKLNSTSHGQQLDISIDNTNSTTEPNKYNISFNSEQKLSKSINKEENKQSSEPRAYCCSPDLFSSDDDNDFRNTKFQASPETNSNQKGIEYFESFSADSCTLSQEMYKSSNQYNSVSHEMVEIAPKNDDQKQNDTVIEVVDSDEDSVTVANEESKERERTKDYHTEHTWDTTSCKDNSKGYIKDLSNKNIMNHGCNRSKSYTTDNESYGEIKFAVTDLESKFNETKNREKIENPTIQNQELVIKDQYLEPKRRNSRSPLNCVSNNLTTNIDFDIPRCSSTSKVCSPSFNSNSKLNVTDYIENMLGEDYITDKGMLPITY
ncbi:unnamed protein product [Callosobruchus maculatus]|uniref:Uncharacterized protein n=1 Tax=Callosobruchus maculatus TaxID=64391 RepID=A0A653BY15_CALMS|nr:unnamed protein product [Callosobruchus maculatus]